MQQGFASLAVVPIRYRQGILGAIHLADLTPERVPTEVVRFLEDMAMLIGEAVHRFDIEVNLRTVSSDIGSWWNCRPTALGWSLMARSCLSTAPGRRCWAETVLKRSLDAIFWTLYMRTIVT